MVSPLAAVATTEPDAGSESSGRWGPWSPSIGTQAAAASPPKTSAARMYLALDPIINLWDDTLEDTTGSVRDSTERDAAQVGHVSLERRQVVGREPRQRPVATRARKDRHQFSYGTEVSREAVRRFVNGKARSQMSCWVAIPTGQCLSMPVSFPHGSRAPASWRTVTTTG